MPAHRSTWRCLESRTASQEARGSVCKANTFGGSLAKKICGGGALRRLERPTISLRAAWQLFMMDLSQINRFEHRKLVSGIIFLDWVAMKAWNRFLDYVI